MEHDELDGLKQNVTIDIQLYYKDFYGSEQPQEVDYFGKNLILLPGEIFIAFIRHLSSDYVSSCLYSRLRFIVSTSFFFDLFYFG